MGVLKGERVYPASGLTGQVFYQGELAVDALVTRTYDWQGEEHRDTTRTDGEGRFTFASVEAVWRAPFFVQFVSHQAIFVNYRGQEYQIWGCGKLKKEEFGEFGGKPKEFRCELTDDVRRVDLPRGFVGTNCHWDL